MLRYALTNRTEQALSVSVCASLPNFIGTDGSLTARGHAGAQYFIDGGLICP